MKKEYLQNILNRVMHKSWTILPQMLVLLKHLKVPTPNGINYTSKSNLLLF
jgi:hypothetical protein